MSLLRRSLYMSQSLCQFYKLINHGARATKNIIYFKRFVSNSGYLISGCCFSRQSNEETLLAKNNHDISGNQPISNLQIKSAVGQHVTDKMKRSCDLPDEKSSQCFSLNSEELIETSKKRLKTGDSKSDDTEIHAASTNENLGLPKNKDVTFETVKSEAAVEKPKKQRPNYFVAVKISDAQIIKALNELQQHILEKDQRFKKSMIQLTTLHITLMVMYIGDTETHARALKTLENIHQEHNDDLSRNPIKLEFKGLSHFQNRVLYAKLSADESYERLSSLAESVKKHYAIASISSTDSKKDFTPHLTVMKIRDNWKKKKEFPKKINPSVYKDFNDYYFGTQEVQSIQLLSMTDPKDNVGYYSGDEIFFSAFEPKVRRDYLNKMLETEEKKKNVKELINTLMKEKLK